MIAPAYREGVSRTKCRQGPWESPPPSPWVGEMELRVGRLCGELPGRVTEQGEHLEGTQRALWRSMEALPQVFSRPLSQLFV